MRTKTLNAATIVVVGALLGGTLLGCASTPPYQGFTTDQLFEVGAAKFAEGDWDKAAEIFERMIFADPAAERLVEARMYLARSYFNKKDYLTAVAEFSRVVDRHPGHPMAAEASLGVCQAFVALSPHVQRDQGYTTQALNSCENTLADFSTSPVAGTAAELRDRMLEKLAEKIFVAGDFYFRRKIYNSAILYFDNVLEEYPRTSVAAQALLRLYQSYVMLEWDREAQEAKDRLLRDYPDSPAARSVRSESGGLREPAPGGGGPQSGDPARVLPVRQVVGSLAGGGR
jgi:outer membrane protein assembly factor BamD